MLFNEVNWKESLPFACESRKGLYFSRNCPGVRLDIKFYGISHVSFVLIFNLNNLMYNNYTKRLLSTNRYLYLVSSQLKKNFNKKSGKFENIFPIICSIKNLRESWYNIKSKPGNVKPGVNRVEVLGGLALKWLEETSKKLLLGFYKYKPSR